MRLADCRLWVAWIFDADYVLRVLDQVLYYAWRKYDTLRKRLRLFQSNLGYMAVKANTSPGLGVLMGQS